MNSDDIEIILKQNGWTKTVGAPSQVIDYQTRDPKYIIGRIILYPSDTKYLTAKWLDEIMKVENDNKTNEIIDKAKEEYEASQMKIAPLQAEKVAEEELKLRVKLKELIDKIPSNKILEFSTFMTEFITPSKSPVIAIHDMETPLSVPEIKGLITGADMIVVRGVTEQDAQELEWRFVLLKRDDVEYKSAVVIEDNKVRCIEVNSKTKAELVTKLNLKTKEDADDVVFLFDSYLKKILTIDKVERSEDIVAVEYTKTGFKADWLKVPKTTPRFKYIETDRGLILVNEKNEPVFEQKRSKRDEDSGIEVKVK